MGTRLYVGNLPFGMGEAELRALFEEEGRRVVDVRLISDRMTGQARGFGFVEMGSEPDAQAAIQSLHGRSVQGRSMVVNEARDRVPGGAGGAGPSGPRPPYRGSPGGGGPPPRGDRPPMGGGGPRPPYAGGGAGGPRPGGFGGPRPGGGFGGPRPGGFGGGGGGGFGGGPPGISKSGGERRRKPKSEKTQKEEKERDRRASGRRKVAVEDWKEDLDTDTADAPDDYTSDHDDADE